MILILELFALIMEFFIVTNSSVISCLLVNSS